MAKTKAASLSARRLVARVNQYDVAVYYLTFGTLPVPVSGILCGEPTTLSLISSSPVCSRPSVGLKVTRTLQLFPGSSGTVHSLVAANGRSVDTPVTDMTMPDFFELSFLMVTFLGLLVVSSRVFLNFTSFGEIFSLVSTGVAVGVAVGVAETVGVGVAEIVGVADTVGVDVTLGVAVRVALGDGLEVAVGVLVALTDGLGVAVRVTLDDGLGVILVVGVALRVAVAVGVADPPIPVAVAVAVAVGVAVAVAPVAVAVGVGFTNGVGHVLPTGSSTVRNALVAPLFIAASFNTWNPFEVTGKSCE